MPVGLTAPSFMDLLSTIAMYVEWCIYHKYHMYLYLQSLYLWWWHWGSGWTWVWTGPVRRGTPARAPGGAGRGWTPVRRGHRAGRWAWSWSCPGWGSRSPGHSRSHHPHLSPRPCLCSQASPASWQLCRILSAFPCPLLWAQYICNVDIVIFTKT